MGGCVSLVRQGIKAGDMNSTEKGEAVNFRRVIPIPSDRRKEKVLRVGVQWSCYCY